MATQVSLGRKDGARKSATVASLSRLSSSRGESIVSRERGRYTHGSRDIRKLYYSHIGGGSSSSSRGGGDHSHLPQHMSDSMEQHEPIYRDIDESRQTPEKVTPVGRGSSVLAGISQPIYENQYYDEERETATFSRSFVGRNQAQSDYGAFHTPTRTQMNNKDMPFLYGDPVDSASVNTGMSQQDLIRKKVREASKSRKRHKNKKRDRILNIPGNLSVGAGMKKVEDTVLGLTKKKHSKVVDLLKVGSGSDVSKKPAPSPDDVEMSTTDSTNLESDEAAYEIPLSELPRASVVNEDVDVADLLEARAVWTNTDVESIGEESFPMLTSHAGGLSFPGKDKDAQSEEEKRGVRFSRNRESITHLFTVEDNGDAPWDERHDDKISPTSVMNMEPSGPLASFSTSTEKPKSILRAARFSPPSGFGSFARGPYGSLLASRRDTDDRGVNTSVSMSPPRNGTGFADHGVELSPIQQSQTEKCPLGHPAEKQFGVIFREIVDKANCLYPDPSLVHEMTSMCSDPTLEFLSESNIDDDSTIMSTVTFIQSVAAIVIQTAFRRYRSKMLVEAIRREKQVGIQTKSLVQSIVESQTTEDDDKFLTEAARLYVLAAIRIQSVFRGFWVRDCMSVDHYCAKVIQTAFRGFRCRNWYMFDLYRIMVIQSAWRRKIAHVKADNHLTKQKRRGTANEDAAATAIQACWRGYMTEAYIIQTLVDILIVQSVARRWLALRKVQALHQTKRRRSRFEKFRASKSSRVPLRNLPEPSAHPTVVPTKKISLPKVEQTRDVKLSVNPLEESSPDEHIAANTSTTKKQESEIGTREGAKSVLSIWKEREKQALMSKGMNTR